MQHARRAVTGLLVATAFVLAVLLLPAAGATTPAPLVAAPTAQDSGAWSQFGGPGRDFTVGGASLAERWPAGTPPVIWDRELGPGYSSIIGDGERLFTMFAGDESETVVALDPASGEEVWATTYGARSAGMNYEYGPGPHAAPLLAGGRLFTMGSTGKLHALDPASGDVLWSRDLIAEMGGTVRDRGHSSSPLAWGDTLIMMVGGEDQALVALRQDDGATVWHSGDFSNGHSSPTLIEVDGQQQVVAFLSAQVAGFDPESGEQLWAHDHQTSYGLNISLPVWDGRTLLVSSGYGTGSRGIRLQREGGRTTATESWTNNRIRAHFGTIVRRGDIVYASSGDFGPAFLTAFRISTGEEIWRDRSFSKSSFVLVDDRLLLLDEDGTLALVRVSETGAEITAQAQVFDSRSWTAPTLIGSTAYLRNQRRIMAVDLADSARR